MSRPREHSAQVDRLMQLVQVEMNLDIPKSTQLIERLVSHLKASGELNTCLREMNSREWMILYKAVIEVEGGL